MTPLDHFNCITPLGPAVCVGILDEGSAIEWVTFIKATGEPWLWRNPQFRIAPDITAGRSFVSPFKEPDAELAKHVKRYQNNGWLATRAEEAEAALVTPSDAATEEIAQRVFDNLPLFHVAFAKSFEEQNK